MRNLHAQFDLINYIKTISALTLVENTALDTEDGSCYADEVIATQG